MMMKRWKNVGAACLSALLISMSCMTVFAEEEAENTAVSYSSAGIEFYTDYPGISVTAGTSETISLKIENSTSANYDATLSIEEMPEGWDGYFSASGVTVTRAHVQSGEEASVTFNLEIPDNAAEGTYTVVLGATTSNGLKDTATLTFDIDEIQYGKGSFTSEYPEQEGASGTSFSFSTTLINNSASAQSYALSANAPDGWQVSFAADSTQVASIDVDPVTSQGLTVTITPPATVEAGEYEIPISAISASENLSETLKVTVTGTYALSLSTPSGVLSFDAHANAASDVTLQLTNNSNVALENINLTSSAPSGWTVTFEQSTIESLEAGASVEVTAHVTPSDSAITGDYITSITATCAEASSSADFRVSVKTSTVWGFVAIIVIAALLGGIGYVFKKYGRR